MESELTSLGSSLKVPIVQELAKEKLSSVPSRYIRPHHDHHIISSDLPSLPQIPVIDLHKLFDPNSMDSELHKLHQACKEWGFFQLIEHGVDSSAVETMKLEMQKFFDLPIEEKEKFAQVEGRMEGYGQNFVVSKEQKLDWADLIYLVTLPPHLRKPHLLPKFPPSFRNAIEAYVAQMKVLAMRILSQMARALGMNCDEMERMFGEGVQAVRMNYYPPCPQPELVAGLSPHSDGAAITILLQVSEMEGLQIKKDGIWIPVRPLPDAFVVNIGDILEIVTNGTYPSVEHRAAVNAEKERLSIATFLSLKREGELGPAGSLITSENPAKFKRIAAADYVRGYYSRELNGKSYVDTMKI